jgi:hypothetical protein
MKQKAILAACIFLMAILFFYGNLSYLSQQTFVRNNDIFGADTADTVDAMRQLTFGGDMRKHLFFSVSTFPLVRILQKVFAVSQDSSIRLVLALLGALNVTGVFLLLKYYFTSMFTALAFTFFYAFCFSNLVLFSIPETYAQSNLMTLIYFAILIRVRDSLNWSNSIILSLLAGLAALYNPALLSLIIMQIILSFRQSSLKRRFALAMVNTAVGGLLFLSVNYLIQGKGFVKFFWSYSSTWASLSNLLDLKKIAGVAVNFFFYSISSPVDHLPAKLGLHDLSGYLQSPLRLILLFVVISCILCGTILAISRRGKNRGLALSSLAWMLAMILFYTYFNPQESLLYSSQVLLPLLLIMANTFETIQLRPLLKYCAMMLVCVLLAINNFLSFYTGT